MAKTLDTLLETETIIRWDQTGDDATLWTADIAVRREWEANGFPVVKSGSAWATRVPASRISYKPLRKP